MDPEADRLINSFEIALAAENLSERTIETYRDSVRDFARYLYGLGAPFRLTRITREHVQSFLAHLLSSTSPFTGRPYKPATAYNRYKGLLSFFRWAFEMKLIRSSPMQGMRPPRLPEQMPGNLTEADVKAMLASCKGGDFNSRRDLAILLLMMTTGVRLNELATLTVDDIDWKARPEPMISVLGKGGKPRSCAFGKVTLRALDLYVNWARKRHPRSDISALWLGHKGCLTKDGIYKVIVRRARAAGIKAHPHLLRHLFAYRYLVAGGQETSLMRHMGWASHKMVSRYTRGVADKLAREERYRLHLEDGL